MPRKPKALDQLSPAYRKRIESAMKRGLSRSQARGHARLREIRASDKKLLSANVDKLEARLASAIDAENNAAEWKVKKQLNRRQLLAKIMGIEDAEERAKALELFNRAAKDKFRRRKKRGESKTALDELETYLAEIEDSDFGPRLSPIA